LSNIAEAPVPVQLEGPEGDQSSLMLNAPETDPVAYAVVEVDFERVGTLRCAAGEPVPQPDRPSAASAEKPTAAAKRTL
jgi:hypothetical protein